MAEREHDFQRLSSSSRRWKRKLIVKHHQLHWKSLLRDAVPLFVGASFSRAVTDVINAACGSGRIHLQIMVMFLYSLFVAHIVGYITNWFVPLEHPLASYYVDIANDNAAFGWSTTITLVILNWLYKKQRVAIALVAWMFLIFIVCCIIYFAGYFQRFYLKPSLLIHYRLRVFESEAFALAAAYSVTVIIASSIYHNESTDYLSNTDDLNLSLDNDSNSTLSRSSWYFFTYAFVWTVLLVIYQRYLDKSSLSSKLSSDDNSIKPHSVEKCIVDGEIILEESDCDPIENYITDYDKGNECEENIEDSNIGPITSSAETVLFSWDHNNRCRNTYRSFYYTFIGYMVSCAWTVWALLSFENLFHFYGGQQIGLLVYALIASLLVASLLTILTGRRDIKRYVIHLENTSGAILNPSDEVDAIYHNVLDKNKSVLYVLFARLTVGWAWQELFSSIIGIIIPDGDSNRAVLLALSKILFAVSAFLIGAKLEIMLRKANGPSRFIDKVETPLL